MAAKMDSLSQPSKVLIVHLCTPADFEMCCRLVDVLEQFFVLVCSIAGSARIPMFGLAAAGSQGRREILLSLQQVRSNFPHIHATLRDLKALAFDWTRNGVDDEGHESLVESVGEVLTLYQQQAQGFLQAAGYSSSQLEIVIFTTKSTEGVVAALRRVLQSASSQIIKKVEVISNSPASLESPQTEQERRSQSTLDDLCDVIESLVLPPDEVSVRGFFMSWIHDGNTDNEHLHLTFDGLCIKCDVKDSLISPMCLQPLVCRKYCLNSFEVPIGGGTGGRTSLPAAGSVVRQLEVILRVPLDSVCDSLTFGSPLVAVATSCWKLDWDDLQMNSQNFRALCHLLHVQKEVLIARLVDQGQAGDSTAKRFNSGKAKPLPKGLFVLMASGKGSLLVKGIVGSELYLPHQQPADEGPISDDSLCVVSAALDDVAASAVYNPLTMDTDLGICLLAQLTTGASHQPRPSNKKPAAASDFTEAGFNSAIRAKQARYTEPSAAISNKTKYTEPSAAISNKTRYTEPSAVISKKTGGGRRKLLNPTNAFNLGNEFDMEF